MKGDWEEEVRCPRVSPLTMTRVIRGPKGRKQKELTMLDVETGQEIDTETGRREVEEIPDSILPEVEEEPLRISPTYPLSLEVQKQVPVQAGTSTSTAGNAEIMEMLKTMKKKIEERELKWEQQQKIKEEFVEATAKIKEQIWEEN